MVSNSVVINETSFDYYLRYQHKQKQKNNKDNYLCTVVGGVQFLSSAVLPWRQDTEEYIFTHASMPRHIQHEKHIKSKKRGQARREVTSDISDEMCNTGEISYLAMQTNLSKLGFVFILGMVNNY